MAERVSRPRSLHTPQNIASLASHTVRGLRLANYHSCGLIYSSSAIQSSDGLEVITPRGKGTPARLAAKLSWLVRLVAASKHFDIIHWYYGRSLFDVPLDIAFMRLVGKPALVEYTGSDIRIPEQEVVENQYYQQAFDNGYEYARVESRKKSQERQAMFTSSGFACAVAPGMRQYIVPQFSPRVYDLPRRLVAADYLPVYTPGNSRPVVVHSPSAPVTKGTACVLNVVNRLQRRYDFDFQLVQNMPRDQAMKVIQGADIFLDQFVLGDYGMASMEAMAFGKPVVCFIKPSLVDVYGPDLPVVNATQETLEEALEKLLFDTSLRTRLGQLGRRYVEQNYNMPLIVPRLLDIYTDLVR